MCTTAAGRVWQGGGDFEGRIGGRRPGRYNVNMPAHDWTRVTAGTFHSFHLGWIAELTRALNGGLLPSDYYALAEQRAAEFEPDLLALERREDEADVTGDGNGSAGGGGTA